MKVCFYVLLAFILAAMILPQTGLAMNDDPGFSKGLIADGGPWEVRWFNYSDPALVAAGYFPLWVVTIEDEEKAPFEGAKWDEFLYINDPDKKAMSSMAFGQRVTLGANLIPNAMFTIDFQCQCGRDPDRCPSVTMIIVPEEFWDEVALKEPGGGGIGDENNSIDLTEDPIWSQAIWNSTFADVVGEDAEEWTKGEANKAELQAALISHAGERVVVGILFGCGHLGEAETGMFDNFMFTGGSPLAVDAEGKLATCWGIIKTDHQ